jgi:hypothetical protein
MSDNEHGSSASARAQQLTSSTRPHEARAAAYGERSTFGPAARMNGFKAEWRHQPVVLGTKEMYQLEGYSSIVGLEYEMWDAWGPYGETMAPGAFDETLAAGPDVAFLVNHRGVTMARTTNDTLQLSADARGEKVLAFVNPQRVDVHDLLVAIDDEHITEMSFAFMITEAEWDEDYEHLTITKVDQDRGDVSAVNYGANPYTSIAARSREFLRDLSQLPDGAQRAALAQLAERFGGVLLPSATGHGFDEGSPARLRQIARNGAKPVQQPGGRSIAMVLAELDVDL